DKRNKLEAYRIAVDTAQPLPAELGAHVSNVVRRPRNPDVPVSPNSKEAVARRRFAASQNEHTGVQKLAPYLLFVGAAEMDDRVAPVELIVSKNEINLNRFFLPPAPSKDIKKTWGNLSQPRPDTCIGYIRQSDANKAMPRCSAPFSPEQESILDRHHMYFPFLTAQWKVPGANENLHDAQNQAARDGAVIVNCLWDLYRVAYNRTPSVLEACHFSWLSDLEFAQLWVHWREGAQHYMEHVDDFSLRKEDDVCKARGFLRNIVNSAVTERLDSIKKAL
ncbi:hypothetical protein BU26DRAFT_401806, partial [Trematosphaeria pertusa]